MKKNKNYKYPACLDWIENLSKKMNSGSPKNEEQVAIPPQKVETSPEAQPTRVPQNTLLNLAKLSTGTPRFEVNSGAHEDAADATQKAPEKIPENGNSREDNSEDGDDKENEPGALAKSETPEEPVQLVLADSEKSADQLNGNAEDAPAQAPSPKKLEIPPDELMQIKSQKSEESPVKMTMEAGEATIGHRPVFRMGDFRIKEELKMGQEKVASVEKEEEKMLVMEPLRMEEEDKEESNQIVEEVHEEPRREIPEETVEMPQMETNSKEENEAEVVVQEPEPIEAEEESSSGESVQEEPQPKAEIVEEAPKLEQEPEAPVEPTLEKVEPSSEPELQPQPEPQELVEPQVQPEPEPESEVESVPEPEPETNPVIEPEPVVESQVEVQPEPVEEVKEASQERVELRVEPVVEEKVGENKIQLEEPEPSPEASPENKAKAEAEDNKLDIEEPEETNPILIRNQQISEDEDQQNFKVGGKNRIFAWGSAECDQFECANYESKRPVEIEFFSSNKVKVSKLTCGSQHTLLLDSAGKVYSWGNSDDGVLGRSALGENADSRPGLVELDTQVDMISAGDSHSVFANSQTGDLFFCGVIKSTGGKLSRVVDFPESVTISKFKKSGIKNVVSGAHHVLIHSRYNVYAFGDNSCGALGYILRTYDERSDCLTPHALRLKGIARIFSGAYHCFAITNKGILKTWGLNSQGQLGLPYYLDNPEDSDINHENPNRNPNVLQLPHQVGGIEGRKIVDIVGGEHHTLMLMSDGTVWGTGRNDDGQLGGLVKPPRDSYEEVRIPNSRVRVAGTNSYVNVTIDYMPNKFMRIPVDKDFQHILASSHFNFAINRAEKFWPKVYSWGTGFNYVLGNGKEETVTTPFRISNEKLFKGLVPTQVALGGSHVVYYTGDTHPVILDEPRPRNNKKRDRSSAIQKNKKYKSKRVKMN